MRALPKRPASGSLEPVYTPGQSALGRVVVNSKHREGAQLFTRGFGEVF
jgi:hypothetical protein